MLTVAISHSLTWQGGDCIEERHRFEMGVLGYPGVKEILIVNQNSLYHMSATMKITSTRAFCYNSRYESFPF